MLPYRGRLLLLAFFMCEFYRGIGRVHTCYEFLQFCFRVWPYEEYVGSIPFFNSRNYLEMLAGHVGREIPSSVLIVVGPKESGKSAGIMQMKRLWRNVGHIILDLNLKGKPMHIKGKDAMNILSKELMQQLQFLSYDDYLTHP